MALFDSAHDGAWSVISGDDDRDNGYDCDDGVLMVMIMISGDDDSDDGYDCDDGVLMVMIIFLPCNRTWLNTRIF